MVFSNDRYIVKVEDYDDGTTCGGKKILTDNYGKKWITTSYTKETALTGMDVWSIDEYGRLI